MRAATTKTEILSNYGWFTVAELDDWIAGHGPIPKAAAGRRG